MDRLAAPRQSCLNCRSEVSTRIARVIGDERGNVPRCPDCTHTQNNSRPRWHTVVERHIAHDWTSDLVRGGDGE
jgi:hypothetical protein